MVIQWDPLNGASNAGGMKKSRFQSSMTIFRRGPPNGGVECRGMKNRELRPIGLSRFISEMIQDRAMVIVSKKITKLISNKNLRHT